MTDDTHPAAAAPDPDDGHPPMPEATSPTPPAEDETRRRRDAADAMLLDALAAGVPYLEAGELANVSARTVRRRMTDPAFAAEVARRRSLRVSDLTGRLTTLADRAIGALEEGLASDRVVDRLRSAELLLASLRRFRADGDIDLRLTVLEAGALPSPAVAPADGEL